MSKWKVTTSRMGVIEIASDKIDVTEAGALILSRNDDQVLRIFAPGVWQEVEVITGDKPG